MCKVYIVFAEIVQEVCYSEHRNMRGNVWNLYPCFFNYFFSLVTKSINQPLQRHCLWRIFGRLNTSCILHESVLQCVHSLLEWHRVNQTAEEEKNQCLHSHYICVCVCVCVYLAFFPPAQWFLKTHPKKVANLAAESSKYWKYPAAMIYYG